jgi:UDP-N-acetylmuramate dehydrogenase
MIEIKKDILLAPYTSWLIGGPAEFFALPESLEDIKELLAWAKKNSHKITIIGGGSNVLISDQGIKGLTICLKNFSKVEIKEENHRLQMICDAGASKSELLRHFIKRKLAPALFLAGLPGDIGGGVVMNAGVAENFRPREFVEITDWIEVLRFDGKIERILGEKLQWSYRHCVGWAPGIIVRVAVGWPIEPDETILDQVKAANKVRLSKQPLDMPSCGSVFINPEGHKSAQLIDSCGLKGFKIGDAQVSMKHANFIVNLGKATADDTWKLIQHVQQTVLKEKGIHLKTEVIRL